LKKETVIAIKGILDNAMRFGAALASFDQKSLPSYCHAAVKYAFIECQKVFFDEEESK